MTTINDAIYQTTMIAVDQGAKREGRRIWALINLDQSIPNEMKAKLRDLIFGVDADEPVFKEC